MQQSPSLERLEEVIANLNAADGPGRRPPGSCELLLEHLEAARRNLLGRAMLEYALNLEQALDSIGCIEVKDLQARTTRLLQDLQTDAAVAQSR